MPRYKFVVSPDGQPTVTEFHECKDNDAARKKYNELMNEHCPKVIHAEFVTASKPCSGSVSIQIELGKWSEI